jgi:hypothetical protein
MTAVEPGAAPAHGRISAYTLALNYLPLAYIVAGAAATWSVGGTAARWGVGLAWVYLLPPLVSRITLTIFGRPDARGVRQDAREYKVWWFLTQWQVLFNRLPWLEELLRLVPGLYGTWLNLWGARVSLFAYWGPSSRILDRYLVHVERGAVIGTESSITGHLGTIADDGAFVVDIGTVTIGEGAIIGARVGLAPGCRIGPHELVPAGRLLQPFSLWTRGHKVKEGGASA